MQQKVRGVSGGRGTDLLLWAATQLDPDLLLGGDGHGEGRKPQMVEPQLHLHLCDGGARLLYAS